MENKPRIYLDSAATTYTAAEVFNAMQPYFSSEFGNPASIHEFGRNAEMAVSNAREQVAKLINADPSEIYFTSGATEANNWALKGVIEASPVKRVLISRIEHPSIIETAEYLKKQGAEVDYIDVDKNGVVIVADLIAKLAKPAALVSVMTANNEVGTIQFINTIANICEQNGVLFHTDATQAVGSVFIDAKEMKIDLLSMSAHKIYGPKGVGALFIKKGTKIAKFMHGGHQEKGKRAGTSNVPAIVGFGKAAEIAIRDAQINNTRLKTLRDYFINEIQTKIEAVKLNGHPSQRLANNVNFSFGGVEGESILMMLDMIGVAASTGSACNSGTLERSHVLTAMGVADELINGSVRFSLSRSTTKEELDYVVENLVKIIKKLRGMSPLSVHKAEKTKK